MCVVSVGYCGFISSVEVPGCHLAKWDPGDGFIFFQSPFIFLYFIINYNKQTLHLFMIKTKVEIISKEYPQELYNCHQTIIKCQNVSF